MATIATSSFSTPAMSRNARASASGFKAFWRQFWTRAFNPYRPELHYMRGPGPAWHAKYGAEASFRLKSEI
jgi:hypothetical protein